MSRWSCHPPEPIAGLGAFLEHLWVLGTHRHRVLGDLHLGGRAEDMQVSPEHFMVTRKGPDLVPQSCLSQRRRQEDAKLLADMPGQIRSL